MWHPWCSWLPKLWLRHSIELIELYLELQWNMNNMFLDEYGQVLLEYGANFTYVQVWDFALIHRLLEIISTISLANSLMISCEKNFLSFYHWSRSGISILLNWINWNRFPSSSLCLVVKEILTTKLQLWTIDVVVLAVFLLLYQSVLRLTVSIGVELHTWLSPPEMWLVYIDFLQIEFQYDIRVEHSR